MSAPPPHSPTTPETIDDIHHAWPYDVSWLEESLDPALISVHGEQQLYRALNLGQLVAFVGSGVSMAYGRINWQDLVSVLRAEHGKSDGKSGEPAVKRYTNLKETLKLMKPDQAGDMLPTVFQVLENLDDAGSGGSLRSSGTPSRFRMKAMLATRDEREQVKRLLVAALKPLPDWAASVAKQQPSSRDNAARSFMHKLARIAHDRPDLKTSQDQLRRHPADESDINDGSRVPPGSLFDVSRLRALIAVAHAHFTQGNKKTFELLRDLVPEGQNGELLPLQRYISAYVVSVAIAILAASPKLQGRDATALFEAIAGGLAPGTSAKPLGDPAQPTDPAALPMQRDPLLLLSSELEIRRYLTTNFDFEIERMFHRRGMRRQPDGPDGRQGLDSYIGPLGHAATAHDFRPERAGELISFAIQDGRPDDHRAFHLHGRAIADSSLVVTEGDYNRLYLRRDDGREFVDEAIGLAFSANPLLFVGLGMREDDLLRPLRQFLSERSASPDRIAIALLPADDEQSKRVRTQIGHFVKYGVYTLYFGSATLAAADPVAPGSAATAAGGETQSAPPGEDADWLHTIASCADKLDKFLAAIETPMETSGQRPPEPPAWTSDALKECKLARPLLIENQPSIPGTKLSVDGDLLVLERILHFCRAVDSSWGRKEAERDLASSLRVAVRGARDSVMGAALCAKLLRIRQDWREWWENWRRLPDKRPAYLVWTERERQIFVRHAIVDCERFKARQVGGTGEIGPAFIGFMNALRQTNANSWHRRAVGRRRVFIIAAPRGTGKGQFFNALQRKERLNEFIRTSWTGSSTDAPAAPPYRTAIFLNLSFSSEVVSCWDELVHCLTESIVAAEGGDDEQKTTQARDELQMKLRDRPRLSKLDYLVKGLADRPSRVLIAINGVDQVFDPFGLPKNQQVARLFDTLLGPGTQGVPIDLVLVTGETRIPVFFRTHAAASPVVRSDPAGAANTASMAVGSPEPLWGRKFLRMPGRNVVVSRVPARLEETGDRFRRSGMLPLPAGSEHLEHAVVHLLRPPRPVVVAAAYFSELALLMRLSQRSRAQPTTRSELRTESTSALASPGERLNALGAALSTLVGVKLSWEDQAVDFIGDPDVRARALAVCLVEKAYFESGSEHLISQLVAFECEVTQYVGKVASHDDAEERAKLHQGLRGLAGGTDSYALMLKDAELLGRRLKQIFEEVGRNRFAFTLLLEAADQLRRTGTNLGDAADKVEALLENVGKRAVAASGATREEAVIAEVLDLYEHFPERDPQEHWQDLCLLRHLAVIGRPTEADVLARCPAVFRMFNNGNLPALAGTQKDWTDIENRIETRLASLERHGLAFRIDIVETDARPRGQVRRYALHRLMQRHILRRMDNRLPELASFDLFSITLYPAQPAELPRLSSSTYEFFLELVQSLASYPYAPLSRPDVALHHEAEPSAERDTLARCMRAALGVIRTFFGVAVVSRLDGTAPEDGRRGYLDEVRRVLRWLLRLAVAFGDRDPFSTPARTLVGIKPFYAEQIVWLYNECALAHLVQGRLAEAVALFRQAMRAADEIEGERSSDGPLRTRIRLNQAIAELERGRARSARALLTRVASVPDEHPVLTSAACGYIGVLDYLAGEHATARDLLTRAMHDLRLAGHYRGASIFARFLADQFRGEKDQGRALNMAREAVALAERGGHEDVRQFARLSLVKIIMLRDKGEDTRGIPRDLDAIESYAKVMGIARLEADVLRMRSALLLKQGETRIAGSLAARSLRIANINDMGLRKVAACILLASSYQERGMTEAATLLARQSQAMARRALFQIAADRAERILARIPVGTRL